MYLAILVEQLYSVSSWFSIMYDNLIKTAKIKRISYERYDTVEAILGEKENIQHTVIIGSEPKWLNEAIEAAYKKESNIIVYANINLTHQEFNHRCNIVSSDTSYTVSQITSLFKENNRTSSALYGINPNSFSDRNLCSFYSELIKPQDIYLNKCNLQECFNSFYKNLEKYDSIVCANDYSAISLLNNLKRVRPQRINELFIISYSDFIISKYYSPSISTFNMNFSEFGQTTMFICEYFDNPHSNKDVTFAIKIPCVFNNRVTTENKTIPDSVDNGIRFNYCKEISAFTNDPTVAEISCLETVINKSNDTDKKIIKMLINNNTRTEIENKLFMSKSGLRYRIERLVEYGNCKDISELTKLFIKYGISF